MSSPQPFRNINSTINAGETDQRQRRDSAGSHMLLCHCYIRTFTSIPSLWTLKIHFPGHLSGVLCSVDSSLPQLNRKKGSKSKKKKPSNNQQSITTTIKTTVPLYHTQLDTTYPATSWAYQQKSRKIHKLSRASRGCLLVFFPTVESFVIPLSFNRGSRQV